MDGEMSVAYQFEGLKVEMFESQKRHFNFYNHPTFQLAHCNAAFFTLYYFSLRTVFPCENVLSKSKAGWHSFSIFSGNEQNE
jgi:hypothetical protein